VSPWLLGPVQAAVALLLAPGLVGAIRWMKARLQNRKGSPPWQPYLELRKLFAKEVVVSNNASWPRAAPFIVRQHGGGHASRPLAVPLPFDGAGDLPRRGLPAAARHVLPGARGPRPGLALRRHGSEPRDDGGGAGRADQALAIFALA
jgi:hypothetical protein